MPSHIKNFIYRTQRMQKSKAKEVAQTHYLSHEKVSKNTQKL